MEINGRPANWDDLIEKAETILSDQNFDPSVDTIISAIKQINPTPHIHLSDSDKELAYNIKSDLQNYLLEQYPDLFDLETMPWDENIVFIRHKVKPLIDVCHAKLHLLSEKALEGLRKADSVKLTRQKKKRSRTRSPESITVDGIASCIDKAKLYLDKHDHVAARNLLADMEINRKKELPALLRGVSILRDELGAYDHALAILLNLPDDLMSEDIKEKLANLYWLNNQFDNARGLFEECNIHELKKQSVYRYADLLHKMKESRAAYDMLEFSERQDGHIDGIEVLRRDISNVLKKEAEPYLEKAQRLFDDNNFKESEAEVRQVLSICPYYEDARDLLKILRAIRNEDEVETLWEEYSNASASSTKLVILNKLKNKDSDKESQIDHLINLALIEQKQLRIENMLKKTTHLLEKGNNENAFEKLYELLKEEQGQNHARELVDQYPHIQCILDNGTLMSLKISEAKECWVAYLELLAITSEVDMNKCEMLLKKTEKCFSLEPQYKAIHKKYTEAKISQSRQSVQSLIEKLQQEDVTLEAAERIVPLIKKDAKGLPKQEYDSFLKICESVLSRLRSEFSIRVSNKRYEDYCNQLETGDGSLEEAERLMAAIEQESIYIPKEVHEEKKKILLPIIKDLRKKQYIDYFRKSRLYGDVDSANIYRDKIGYPQELQKIEKEVSELYSIAAAPLGVNINSDISKGFPKEYADKLRFLGFSGDIVFFNLKIGNVNYLAKLNIKERTAWKYKLVNLDIAFTKIIDSGTTAAEYHFLCDDPENKCHYLRISLQNDRAAILCHHNLSALLGLEENSAVNGGLFLSGNYRSLYALYIPDEDEWDERFIGIVDLYKGTVDKNKKIECMGEIFAHIPKSPPRLLLSDTDVFLYNEKLQKVKKLSITRKHEYIDQVSVDDNNKLLYIYKLIGKNDEMSFVKMDYDFNILESYDDISSKYRFSFFEKYYDPIRDIIHVRNLIYDYRKKKVIKDFGENIFSEDDFILFPESMDKLVQSLQDDGINVADEIKEEVSNLDYLNIIIKVPYLYEELSKEREEIQLSGDLLKRADEIKELRVKSHDIMEDFEWRQIMDFNRDLLEVAYPEIVPKVRNINKCCFFIKHDTNQYMTCGYDSDKKMIILSDVSSYIDMLIDVYKRVDTSSDKSTPREKDINVNP